MTAPATIALAAVLYFGMASAQNVAAPVDSRATLTGTVYNPVGTPVDGMLVSIESGPFGSGVSEETLTNTAGEYRFDKLLPGVYTISLPIEFAPPVTVSLEARQRLRQDIRVQIDEVSGIFSVCVDCGPARSRYVPPDSLVSEFASDRDAAVTQNISAAEPAVGWEYYEPNVQVSDAIRDRRLTGSVVLEGRVESDGSVKNVSVVSSPHPELSAAAVAALRNERWKAATVRGVPIAAPLRLTIEFLRRTTPQ